MTGAKICGLKSSEGVDAALAGGAGWLGFVSFPRSPRHVEPQAASRLATGARGRGVKVVAVVVDPTDAELDRLTAALAPDLFQLHGRETPERAGEVRRRTGRGVVKAMAVSSPADLAHARSFESVVEHLMFDAKPPADHPLPGGAGVAFDWTLLKGERFERPWFLAGGLNPWNVADAVGASGAPLVDVSSGVERGAGCKDPALISAFLEAVRRL